MMSYVTFSFSIIIDAVYFGCSTIRRKKSATVSCLILFMTYWHKVQMSNQAGAFVLMRSMWNRNRGEGYLVTFLVNIFHLLRSCLYLASLESLTNTNLTSRAFAIIWTWRHLYKRGWVTWMEMIPDRRCSIWFPNKVYCSSRNKFAECRINSIFLCSNLSI